MNKIRENMTVIDDGGPAFPLCYTDERGIVHRVNNGMTLRDWFAGQIINGLLTSNSLAMVEGDDLSASFAKRAYNIADAMLAARRPQ